MGTLNQDYDIKELFAAVDKAITSIRFFSQRLKDIIKAARTVESAESEDALQAEDRLGKYFNQRNDQNQTLLLYAASLGEFRCCEELLDLDCPIDIFAEDNTHSNLFDYCDLADNRDLRHKAYELIWTRSMLEYREEVRPLIHANGIHDDERKENQQDLVASSLDSSEKKNSPVRVIFVDCNYDINILFKYIQNNQLEFFSSALKKVYFAIRTSILLHGDFLNTCNRKKQTLLLYAGSLGRFDFCRALLTYNYYLDINATDKRGRTLFHYCALRFEHELMYQLVYFYYADPLAKTKKNKTVISFIQTKMDTVNKEDRVKTIMLLLKLGFGIGRELFFPHSWLEEYANQLVTLTPDKETKQREISMSISDLLFIEALDSNQEERWPIATVSSGRMCTTISQTIHLRLTSEQIALSINSFEKLEQRMDTIPLEDFPSLIRNTIFAFTFTSSYALYRANQSQLPTLTEKLVDGLIGRIESGALENLSGMQTNYFLASSGYLACCSKHALKINYNASSSHYFYAERMKGHAKIQEQIIRLFAFLNTNDEYAIHFKNVFPLGAENNVTIQRRRLVISPSWSKVNRESFWPAVDRKNRSDRGEESTLTSKNCSIM